MRAPEPGLAHLIQHRRREPGRRQTRQATARRPSGGHPCTLRRTNRPIADPCGRRVRGIRPTRVWVTDRRRPWFDSEPLALQDVRGKVVLVRWFRGPSCPLCSATAPALNRFDEEYRGRGLLVIGCTTTRTPRRSMSRP